MRIRSRHIFTILALLGLLLSGIGTMSVTARAGHSRVAAPTSALAQIDDRKYPQRLVYEGVEFVFDRLVPLDRQSLNRIDKQGRITLYAKSESAPFDPLYALINGRSSEGMPRYFPTNTASPETP